MEDITKDFTSDWYKLGEDNELIKCTAMESSKWRGSPEGQVKMAVGRTTINGYYFCTSFIMLDHAYFHSEPLVFESIVFCPRKAKLYDHDEIFARYSTYEEALEGHQKVLNAHYKMLYHRRQEVEFNKLKRSMPKHSKSFRGNSNKLQLTLWRKARKL